MNNLEISVVKILECMGVEINNNTFENRLDVQKSIYLAQEAGLDLGFRYNWYIRGPYCPRLTDLLFNISHSSLYSNLNLTDRADERLRRLVNNIESTRCKSINLLSWKELLASVHYLRFQNRDDLQTIVNDILNKKPWYDEEQIRYAYEQLDYILTNN